VSVKALGVIRAVTENHAVKALVSGRIEAVSVKENQQVVAGQVLARIKTDILEQERNMLASQQGELLGQLADLQKLTRLIRSRAVTERPSLTSSVYSQQYTLFWQKAFKLQSQLELA